eukprot:364306-Chlamydomonas_euryale.AAC.5
MPVHAACAGACGVCQCMRRVPVHAAGAGACGGSRCMRREPVHAAGAGACGGHPTWRGIPPGEAFAQESPQLSPLVVATAAAVGSPRRRQLQQSAAARASGLASTRVTAAALCELHERCERGAARCAGPPQQLRAPRQQRVCSAANADAGAAATARGAS